MLTTKRAQRFELESLERRELLSVSQIAAADSALPAEPSQVEQRIVDGHPAENVYPSMVSLQRGHRHFCGGTLIAPDTVLTAAHCVSSTSPREIEIVIGRSDLTSNDGQRIDAEQIFIHPDYNPYSFDSDLAVIRMVQDVSNAVAAYARTSDSHLYATGTDSTIIGWGSLDEVGSSPNQLHEAQVPIVSNEQANDPYAYGGDVTSNMIAAGFQQGGADSCYGDSGGPLLVDDGEGGDLVAGIVSWGRGCGEPNAYGVYTRVANFADWIDIPAGGEWPVMDAIRTATIDETVTGEINYSGDTDSFSLVLESGNTYQVSTTAESLNALSVRLFAADEDLPVANDYFDGVQSQLVFSPSEDGTFFIDVFGSAANTGSFELTVREFVDDHPGPFDATPLESGNVTQQGVIEFENDVDWFSLDVQGGREYDVEVILGSLNDSYITIYDDEGFWITSDDDSGVGFGSQIVYTPNASGTVFLEVSGYDFLSMGSYTLTVESSIDQSVGDVDGDGELSANDIDQLSRAISDGISIAHFDINSDGVVDHDDVVYLVNEVFESTFGDANLDGRFDTGDLVQVFIVSQYEDNISQNSSWASGDWNGDREFDTSDLVVAMQSGLFELIPTRAENKSLRARALRDFGAAVHIANFGLDHEHHTHREQESHPASNLVTEPTDIVFARLARSRLAIV